METPAVCAESRYSIMDKVKRILLIDDEEVITFGFSIVLEEPSVEVDCAQTLEEAVDLISIHQYDAAVIDLRLSASAEMEGFECIRLLRSQQNECIIILLTAYGSSSVREQAKELGVSLFCEKPTEPEVIRESLRRFGIYND